jgi:hypothetical protein
MYIDNPDGPKNTFKINYEDKAIKVDDNTVLKVTYNGETIEFTPKDLYVLKKILEKEYPEYYV